MNATEIAGEHVSQEVDTEDQSNTQRLITEAETSKQGAVAQRSNTEKSVEKKKGDKKGEKKAHGGKKKGEQKTGEQNKGEQTKSDEKTGEQKTTEKKSGEKKKGQQKPPPAPQLLFHESLGRELTQKFADITHNPVRRPSVTSYFATGIIDEQVQQDADAIAATAVLQQAALAEPQNGDDRRSKTPEPKSARAQSNEHIMSPKHEVPTTPRRDSAEEVVEKKAVPGKMYSLRDMNAFEVIEQLVARHGRMTHMGVRDHNYDFFVNKAKSGVISYRLIDDKVAVISGDPICPVSQYQHLLQEFGAFCKHNRWQWSIQGGSREMADIAKVHGWTTVQYGRERALNVQTNPVLLGSEGKRIRTQCKQLQKTVSVGIYCPAYIRDLKLEQQIIDMYDNWRLGRNTTRMVQAYVTVFDMMSLHRLMIFVYTRDAEGKLLGFAALRRLREGYHIDPITVDPDAPRGMTDLLLIASMAFLKESNVTRLVLGVEPLDDLGEITGMSKTLERLTRKSHKLISAELPLGGKKGFNDRFRPEDAFEEKLFMIYPNSPSIKQSVAMAHFANIHLHDAVKQRVAKERERRRRNSDPEVNAAQAAESAGAESPAPVAVAYNPMGMPVVRPQSAARANSTSLDGLRPEQRRQSDEEQPASGLQTPKSRGRASSRIRLFHRHSEDDGRMASLTNLTPSQDNLAIRPALDQRHSSSRLRLFRRGSDEQDDKPPSQHSPEHPSGEAGLLVPPTQERARSRSLSRIRLFHRKSSEAGPRPDEGSKHREPMPLAG